MSVLFILIMISGLIATVFLIGFIWSVRSGQFDDTHSPSVRMLFNDTKPDKEDTAPTHPGSPNEKSKKKES